MTNINKSALVQYSVSEMFELVDDVDTYAEFLPWCGSSEVLSRSDTDVRASVEIAHKGIHKTFTTLNMLKPHNSIEMSLVDGPFKSLHGFWRFEALKTDACKITLDLDYEFSNMLLSMAIGPVFNQIANSLLDAFCLRAEAKYGKR